MPAAAEAIEPLLRSWFADRGEGIAAAYLFASVARGLSRADSDVDVAVLFERDPPRTFGGLPLDQEGGLERLLEHPVQVVVLNHAPVDLVHRVLRDGHLVLDRNREARIAFGVRARNEYFDLLPFLLRYRRLDRA
jgi:uncharacterized protein